MARDPRVRRTRLALHEAMERVLARKDFSKISVQDIAEESGLHRATFYDHYPDKTALLECMVACQFQSLLARRNVSFQDCEGALYGIVLGACDYLASLPEGKGQRLESHMQTAVVAVIRHMLLDGLNRHPRPSREPRAELVAATASWAICGAATEWLQTADRCPAEAIAGTIQRLVAPIFPAER